MHARIATVGIVDDCPSSVAVAVGAADPLVGYTPCGTWGSTTRTTTASESRHHLLSLFLIGLSNGLHYPLLINGGTRQFIVRTWDLTTPMSN
jgi:hypothetical protein